MSEFLSQITDLPKFRNRVDFEVNGSGRVLSRRREFGSAWRGEATHPLHILYWLEDIGELILEESTLNLTDSTIVLVALIDNEEELMQGLAGWERVCGRPGSLDWLRSRELWGRGIGLEHFPSDQQPPLQRRPLPASVPEILYG